METIDKKLKDVIDKEKKKLTKLEKDFFKIVNELEFLSDSINPEYTIPLKDTIGKNIYFNTIRS